MRSSKERVQKKWLEMEIEMNKKQELKISLMYMLIIILIILINGCTTIKSVDDTEHLWRGDNGIEFYE